MFSDSNSRAAALVSCFMFSSVLLLATKARADHIVLIVDQNGHKVYINTGDAAKKPSTGIGRSTRPSGFNSPLIPPRKIYDLVQQTANHFQLDPQLIHAIIQVESEYNPHAVSSKGALGLMQLIPSTARRFGVENPFDPKQNIQGGVSYLKYLLNLFGGDLSLSLAAYNAGESSVLRSGGIPSITETREYVRRVTGLYNSDDLSNPSMGKKSKPYKAPIYRYVDSQGIVHYTNGDEL